MKRLYTRIFLSLLFGAFVGASLTACSGSGKQQSSADSTQGDCCDSIFPVQWDSIHIKTTYARHQAVVQALAQMHPYDVPEIIVLPVIGGAAPYLDWVREQTAVTQNKRD